MARCSSSASASCFPLAHALISELYVHSFRRMPAAFIRLNSRIACSHSPTHASVRDVRGEAQSKKNAPPDRSHVVGF
eukprot:1194134-Prorocentrum_minimum.AAC.2